LIKDTKVDEDEAKRIALDVLIKQAQCISRDDTDLIVVDSLVTLNRECMPEYTPQHNNYTTALKESLQTFGIFLHGFNYSGIGIPSLIEESHKLSSKIAL
jgi:protoporphyrinogen oxidase